MHDEILKNKSQDWPLKKYEERFKAIVVPMIPLWIETYHLTLMTILWSIFVIVCFYLSLANNVYLWLVPFLIFFQHLTDMLDGTIGRERNTGLVKWGFYSDHFLDFIFLTSVVLGYAIILGFDLWIFLIYASICGSVLNTFILLSTNNKFNIIFLGIGPSELRYLVIIFHLFFVYEGMDTLRFFVPYLAVFFSLLLMISFFINQRDLWKIDMKNKNK